MCIRDRDTLNKIGIILRRLSPGKDALVITNRQLFSLYRKAVERPLLSAGFSVRFEMVPDSEKAKSAASALRLINRIAKYDRKRSLFVLAFGGGVIGDLAGFVSAVYKRGIPYIQIPTTLLAQVDSAIGGKTAIDLPMAKNLVGVFYQPKMVVSDISILETLPARQISNGLAEIIKYGVIKDKRLFEFIEKNYSRILTRDTAALKFVIEWSSRIKAEVVESDELDKKGLRAILNYGHTIGHAIEASSGYSSKYNHGESVAIGMVIAADIAVTAGMMNKSHAERIKGLIGKTGLPVKVTGLSPGRILAAVMHDKKFSGAKTRLVLPVTIGKARVVDGIPYSMIKKAIINNIGGN